MKKAMCGIMILTIATIAPSVNAETVAWFNISSRCAGNMDAVSSYLRTLDPGTANHAKDLGMKFNEISSNLILLNDEARKQSEDVSAVKQSALYDFAFSDMRSAIESAGDRAPEGSLLDSKEAGGAVMKQARENIDFCFELLRRFEMNK